MWQAHWSDDRWNGVEIQSNMLIKQYMIYMVKLNGQTIHGWITSYWCWGKVALREEWIELVNILKSLIQT